MSRALTSGMQTAIAAQVVIPVLFCEFDFDGGTLRFWTGYGSYSWGGNTWLGSGNVIGTSAIKEVADNSAQGTSFTLNGVPSALISTALTEPYQGRAAKLWLGAFNTGGSLIADPYQIFAGRMDTMTIADVGDTASITLTAENRLIDLNRSRERRYTPEDQAIDYASDTGLRYIAALQNAQIVWGAASSTVAGSGAVVGGTDGGGDGPI